MTPSNYIELIAAIIIGGSLIFAVLKFQISRKNKANAENMKILLETQKLMFKYPDFLKFHNITQEKLHECGVNQEEFCYILLTFYAGQTYYYLLGKKKINKQTPYRENILSNEKVKKCWEKIIKDRMISNTEWTKSIDCFYKYEFNNCKGKYIQA